MEGEKLNFRPTPPGSAITDAFFMSDQYGLESNFKFAASSNSFSQMDRVIELLEGIEQATKETAQTIASSSLGKDLMKSLNADGVKREGKDIQGAVKKIGNALTPLKTEFRALRAESRNIDFGEITDTRQFKKASNEVSDYIKKLKELEKQITGTEPADREFKAGLKSQQRAAGDKVKLAKANRDASMASERLGFSQAIQGAGQGVLDVFAAPLESAMELQKSMAGVKKLAGDISETGTRLMQNEIFNLSSRLAVEDTQVSAIFEDLAGSGKSFGDGAGGIKTRIAEVEQILKNQKALDVSSGAATQLDVTLGSVYKRLVAEDPGAIIDLNARVASSINQLADKLPDVRIAAEDVIPVMNVVMNTIGDSASFPIDQITAYSAAIASLGTIQPEAAGSFFNRMSDNMSSYTKEFAGALNMDVGQFDIALNKDKLGVLIKIAEAYKNVQGGELAQGRFFGSIHVGSVQDQKLLQGLANNIDTLKNASTVSKGGFFGKDILELVDPKTGKKVMSLGKELGELSIDHEIGEVMKNADFQTDRFHSTLKSLTDTLGNAWLRVTTPFKSLTADVLGVLLRLTQAAPGLTTVLTVLVVGLATLATTAGAAGVALFGFQQAQAIATTAAIGMNRSLIPLTGFFETAMTGFKGTNPWVNAFKQSTVVTEELSAASGRAKGLIAGELRTALIGLRAQVMMTTQGVMTMGRAFLLSPLGLAIGAFLLLDQLLQRANPKVRLLGTLFSVFSSAAGFAFGILEGFVGAFLKLLKVPAGAAGGLLSSPFTAISQALEFAMESFKNWERSGKHIGESIFNILASPFIFAASATAGAWDRTISFIAGLLKPLADLAAYIGYFIQGSLSEHSPGTTWIIRLKWALTALSVVGSFLLMQVSSAVTGLKIREAMGAAAAWVVTNWQVAVEKVTTFFSGLTLPDTLTNFATEIGNAWNNTFGMMTSGWLSFVDTFTSTTPNFGGLAMAGMAAMQPLIAWGLPDVVSEGFDNIVQPKQPGAIATSDPQSGNAALDGLQARWETLWGSVTNFPNYAATQIASFFSPVTTPIQNTIASVTSATTAFQGFTETVGTFINLDLGGKISAGWNQVIATTQTFSDFLLGIIEKTFGSSVSAGIVDFFGKLSPVASTFSQNMATITNAFSGKSANIATPFVAGALATWELIKLIGGLSTAFMNLEEGFLHKVIDGFNLLGFTTLMLSSMLMNLVTAPFESLKSLPLFIGKTVSAFTSMLGLGNEELLEEGASKYIKFLKVFDRPGIGTALAKGLPGIVAILMGMNVFEGLTEQWTTTLINWSKSLPQTIEGIVSSIEGIFDLVEPALLSIYPEGINIFPPEEVRSQVYATLGEAGAIFATFWQNIADSAGKVGDAIKPIFEAIATVKVFTIPQLFANYMGFGDAVQPVTDFIHSLPILGMALPELIVIEAAIGAFLDVLKSPTLAGFVGFLKGPMFDALWAIGNAFFTLGRTIATAFLGIPIFIVKNAIEKAKIAGEATKAGWLDPLVSGAKVAKQAVIDQLAFLPGMISNLLRKVPLIGTFVANAFDAAMSRVGTIFGLVQEALPGYIAAMRTQLGTLKTAFVGSGVALKAVGSSLGSAAKYIINEALFPLAEAIGFLNPFKLIKLYAQTKGFQGVTKGVNPIDLAVTGIDDALVAVATKMGVFGKLQGEALKTAQGAMRPLSGLLAGSAAETARNIAEQSKNAAGTVATGTGEAIDRAFPIRVLSAKLLAVRKTYLSTKAALAYDKAYVMGFNLGPAVEGFVLMRAVFVPMVQIVARAAFSWMTYYTVLEALTPALLDSVDAFARAHTELGFFSKVILFFTTILRVLRFAVVDTTNIVIGFGATFFKVFQYLAPIAGKAAGIIAYGIGLIIKGATLGVQTLGAVLLLPVIAISKVMQGMLIAVKYVTQQIAAEFMSIIQVFKDLGSAVMKGDVLGAFWAIGRLIPTIIQIVVGKSFFSLGRLVTTGMIALAGVALRIATDGIPLLVSTITRITTAGISLLISTIIPFATKAAFDIGLAIVTGVTNALYSLSSQVDGQGQKIGKALSGFIGVSNLNTNGLRVLGVVFALVAGVVITFAVLIIKNLLATSAAAASTGTAMSALGSSASFAFAPWIAGLIVVAFLIWQVFDGFKELNAVINALNHPVQWLQDSMANIAKTFSGGINTDWIAFFVEKLIRVIPIVLGGIFLLGFAVKKHIFGGFMLVWDVVKGIANSLINVVRSARAIPGAVMGIGAEGRVLEGVHKTRSALGLYKDPQQKAARENEFKLAKDSSVFMKEIDNQGRKGVIEGAQILGSDYAHLIKEVEVTKGGFFGIGATKKKEWQLTEAGERTHKENQAKELQYKYGDFTDENLKASAKKVSPGRLGLMGGEQLREIFAGDRPDLAALGRALETIKVQNVAQMNVQNVNGLQGAKGGTEAGDIQYSRKQFENLGLHFKQLNPDKTTFKGQELSLSQLAKAAKALGANHTQFNKNLDIAIVEGMTPVMRATLKQLMAYQLAAAAGKIQSPVIANLASADKISDTLSLTNAEKTDFNSGTKDKRERMARKKIDELKANNIGNTAISGLKVDDMVTALGRTGGADQYSGVMAKYVETLMTKQLATVRSDIAIDPRLFDPASVELQKTANTAPGRVSAGLAGILKDMMDGIGQSVSNVAKKLPGFKEGYSYKAIEEIERKIAGLPALNTQSLQDKRRVRLEAQLRQLRSEQTSAETQQSIVKQMAQLAGRDSYEFSNSQLSPSQLNSHLAEAKSRRSEEFGFVPGKENEAMKTWLQGFNREQQTQIKAQLKRGDFRGGALRTEGQPTTYEDNFGVTRTQKNYVNHEASLAQALGLENIDQVEQAYSTEAILNRAKKGWKEQFNSIVSGNTETKFYNNEIDKMRARIDNQVARSNEGFAQREARRTQAAVQREAGFVAQLNRVSLSRDEFTRALDQGQKKAFNKFMQSGTLRSELQDTDYSAMATRMGFKDAESVKKFQAEMAKEENTDIKKYFNTGLTNPSNFESQKNTAINHNGVALTYEQRLAQIIESSGTRVNNSGRAITGERFMRDLSANIATPRSDEDNAAWQQILPFLEHGRTTTDLTTEQIAEIGRAMNLEGNPEQIAAQLRTLGQQRRTGFGSVTEAIKSFLKGVETDAGSVENYIHERLVDMRSWSVGGRHPLEAVSDILRHILFEPITDLVKGVWNWLGNSLNSFGSKMSSLKARGVGMLASLPGVRTFVAARQRRETDRQSSLQSLTANAGLSNQAEFEQNFRQQLTNKGIVSSQAQDKALQAILNTRKSLGVTETLKTSRYQEIKDNSDKIGEALAATLGVQGAEADKLLRAGGFTTRALAPLRNYFFKAVIPAIIDAGLAPLKLIYGIVRNPQMSLAAIKTKTGQIVDAVSDFLVTSYTKIKGIFSYAATQLGKVPLFSSIWGAVSGFFGKIASKIQGMAAPATTQRLREEQARRRTPESNLYRARSGTFPVENLPDAPQAEIQRLNNTIATLSQFRAQEVSRLNPFQKLLVFATTAARGAKNAWAQTAEEISEGGWRGLVSRFNRIGYLLKRNISEGSPGPSADTRDNWEHTQQAVGQNMGEIANSAHVAGQQIQGDMQRTARRSAGFLGAIGGAVNGMGKAGMAIGGAVTAVGFAAQTASYSLVNMGLIDEASAAKLNKFLEIFTLMGAVGGLLAPVMGAIGSSVGAIGSAFALIFNPVTLTIAAITGGIFLVNEGLKRFAGIDLLGPLLTNVQQPVQGAIGFIQGKIDEVFAWMMDKFGTQLSPILEPMNTAVEKIKGAWQGFVDWFTAMPLVQTAIDIGTGLINALNHNPTVQIPLAWEGAVEQIKGMLFGLPFVGDFIAGLLKDSLDPSKILDNLFQGFHSMLDKLEKSGLGQLGGGKMMENLRGFLGGFGKKTKTEIPVEAGVKLNYKDALESAVRQADFDARSGTAGAQAASANLQYQLKTTGGQMTGDQLGTAYQGSGGKFLQKAIAKENNRLFADQGTAAKEKREGLQQELQALNQKEVALQTKYAEAIGQVQVAAAKPAPTNFFQSLLGGSNNVSTFATQAATVSQSMMNLQAERAELEKKVAATSFVFDSGTDQMLKNIGIDPAGLKVAVAEGKVAIATGIKEVGLAISDRWRYLERSGGGNLGDMMRTDLQKAGGAFHVLKGDVADFAQKAGTSLMKMDWEGFKGAAGDFWSNLTFGLGQMSSGFAGAGLSALMFSIHLAPIAFILGGIALAALAISTNFLGLRSILMGLWRIFSSFVQIVVSGLMMILNVVRGVVKIIGGIPNALRGDFTQLGEGIEIVWLGVKDGARGMFIGLSSVFGGGLEVLGGLFKGLQQTIGIVFGAGLINSAREAVTAIKQLFDSAGETITTALRKPGQVLDGIANRFRKGKEQVADSPIGRTVGAIADVASGKAPNMDAARVAHDFDMKMRGKDPDAQLTASDRARLAQSQMEGVINQAFNTSRGLGADIASPSRGQGVLSEIDDELRRAEAGLGRMKNRSVSAADAANDALSSLGIALSSFAPSLAAPLFLVGDLLSGFTGLSMALPQLGVMFPGVAAAIGTFTTAVTAGTLTVSGAIAGFSTVFAGAMAGISSAASVAWVAISGPMFPIFILVAALVAGFLLFKTNFLGFADAASGVFDGVKDILSGIWDTVTEGMQGVGSLIGSIGGYLIEPLAPLLQLFGIDVGNAGSGLQTAFVQNAITALLLPIRAIGIVVRGIVCSVFAVTKSLLWLGGLVVRIILAPITLVSNAVGAIVRGFLAVGSILATVLLAPFQFLQNVVNWIWGRLTQLPAFLSQAIAGIPFIGPLLQNLGNTLFQGGAQTPVQQFASGGAVVGAGSGTADKIPALLSNGEFVVSAGPAQENMGLLTTLNEGRGVEVMPMPTPAGILLALAGRGEAAQSDSAPRQMPPVEININLQGDIVLAGTNSAADAQEFLTKIEPYLQQAVWGMFRNWVDFNR